MPIFGSHSSAMTPPKSRLISGPMHARHVGGVSITGGTGGNTSLDSYFAPTSLEPDELPSHMYAASGVIEVPRRSNTFTNAVRRPSLSVKRSISRLRSGSGSRSSEGHKRSQSDNRAIMESTGSGPEDLPISQSIQRKPSRIFSRPNINLDWNGLALATRPRSPVFDTVPTPPPKDHPRLNSEMSTFSMSTYSVAASVYDQPPRKALPARLSVRSKRADSGTAVEANSLPIEQRPLGFKEIAAMQHLKDRMALYEKTRDYWANAEHGLAEWTVRTGGPRTFQLRREERQL